MSEALAGFVWMVVGIYFGLGLFFALPFVVRGVGRVDPSARAGTWGFRVLIVPGVAALWPLLLKRWWRRQLPPSERNAHRDLAPAPTSAPKARTADPGEGE